MPGWTLIDSDPTQGCTFQRPLDPLEAFLFWGSRSDGTADDLHHAELRLLNAPQDLRLFSNENIVRAWLSTKRRHPLAGATVQTLPKGGDGTDGVPTFASEPHFVIREDDLAILRPSEIVFGQVTCAEEVTQQMADILGGPRPLSDELLAQLYVFRETDSQRTGVLHLMTLIAHCVSDGTAKRTLMRCLLDTLARGGDPELEPAQVPLEERLTMLIPSGDLEPLHLRSLNPAKRRWRRTIGNVIAQMRMARLQGPGGHTLPCRVTRATQYTPARPGFVSISLTQAQTTTVLGNCRPNGVTLGTALLPLAQVAMTRLLYRRYLRGEMSEEEWVYRKRQPYRNLGPFNLRPHLDKQWFERGGAGECLASIKLFSYELPFMTLGGTEPHQYHEQKLSNGAPPFSDLLTFDLFLHRVGLVRKQANAFFGHPLFFEIMHADILRFFRHPLQPKKDVEILDAIDTHGKLDEEVLAVTDMPVLATHGGSSFGNVDPIVPTEYPLPPTHPLSPFSSAPHRARAGYVTPPPTAGVDTTPRIVLENAIAQLHPRPAELYLGALTSRGLLTIYICYDGNVYEEGVVREWLDEVRGAMLWYLGQTHLSRHGQCGHGSGGAPQV